MQNSSSSNSLQYSYILNMANNKKVFDISFYYAFHTFQEKNEYEVSKAQNLVKELFTENSIISLPDAGTQPIHSGAIFLLILELSIRMEDKS